jgi:isopentenyl phosphate kinase
VRDGGQLIGVSITSAVLEILSARITLTMGKEGVPVYPMRTGSVYRLINGEPSPISGYELFLELMRRGLVPMLHGDVVMSDGGLGIISGDDIMLDLGRALRPGAAIFLMDVPGILRGSDVVRFIDKAVLGDVGGSGGIDVTGGLVRKLRRGFQLATYTKTVICAVWDTQSLRSIIRGEEPDSCTWLLPQGPN